MLPERKRDLAESQGGGHGGFEVRVIGGSAPAAVEPADEERSGVEVGVVIGGASRTRPQHATSTEEAPVLRLEAEDQGEPLKARAMSEVGPAVPRTSSRKKKRDRLQQLTLWMAVGVCGAAILTVGSLMAGRKKEVPTREAAGEVASVPVDAVAAERESFVADADGLINEAQDLVGHFAAAKTAEEVLPLLRDPERVKPLVLQKWQAWGAEPAFASSQSFASEISTGSPRPSIIISGMKGDFTAFRAVFVREKGKVCLDWEATMGAGDLDIADMKAGKEAKDAVLRAEVSTATYFTPDFPETKYASFRLSDVSGEHFTWAYAEIGSPVSKALNLELNEGSFLMQKNSSIAFTLKVQGPVRPGANQYLITEMLHKGWVSP